MMSNTNVSKKDKLPLNKSKLTKEQKLQIARKEIPEPTLLETLQKREKFLQRLIAHTEEAISERIRENLRRKRELSEIQLQIREETAKNEKC